MSTFGSPLPKRQLILQPVCCGVVAPVPLMDALREASDADSDDTTIDEPLLPASTTSATQFVPLPTGPPMFSDFANLRLSPSLPKPTGRRYVAAEPQGAFFYCGYSVPQSTGLVYIQTPDNEMGLGHINRAPTTSRPFHGVIYHPALQIPFIARLISRTNPRMVVCIQQQYAIYVVTIGISIDSMKPAMVSLNGPHRKFVGRKREDIRD